MGWGTILHIQAGPALTQKEHKENSLQPQGSYNLVTGLIHTGRLPRIQTGELWQRERCVQTVGDTQYSDGCKKPWLLSSRNLCHPRAEIQCSCPVSGTRKEMSPCSFPESFHLSMKFWWWLTFYLILFYFSLELWGWRWGFLKELQEGQVWEWSHTSGRWKNLERLFLKGLWWWSDRNWKWESCRLWTLRDDFEATQSCCWALNGLGSGLGPEGMRTVLSDIAAKHRLIWGVTWRSSETEELWMEVDRWDCQSCKWGEVPGVSAERAGWAKDCKTSHGLSQGQVRAGNEKVGWDWT